MKTVLLSGICVLALTGSAMAHPGHGGGAPPSTVTMGPPSAAFSHVPSGVANGHADVDPDVAKAANLLGNLNAAHASTTALAHASPKSMVGAIAAYKTAVSTAEAKLQAAQTQLTADQNKLTTDQAFLNGLPAGSPQIPAAQTAVNNDLAAIATDKANIAAAQAAITSAQNTLALRANKPLTPAAIAQLNALLGL